MLSNHQKTIIIMRHTIYFGLNKNIYQRWKILIKLEHAVVFISTL